VPVFPLSSGITVDVNLTSPTTVQINPRATTDILVTTLGPQGPKGDVGTLWITGSGAPASGTGVVNDFYLNSLNGDYYKKTALTVWTLQGNIKGATGTMTLGTVATGAAGSSVVITNTGTPTAGVFNFTIPRGDQGIQGIEGIQGVKGDTGTMQLGTVSTGAAGSSVVITNTGTATNGIFNFTIPRGDTGIQGPQGIQGSTGPVGPAGLTWRGAWVSTNSYAINDHVTWGGSSYYSTTAKAAGSAPPTGTSADPGTDDTAVNTGWALLTMQGATGPQGIQGIQGPTGNTGPIGPSGTVTVGSTTTGGVGTNASVTNTGTSTAAVLNFTIPQGPQGVQGPVGPAGSTVNSVFTTTTTAGVPIISRGMASQTGNLQEWQSSDSTVRASVNPSGVIYGLAFATQDWAGDAADTAASLGIRSMGTTSVGAVFKGVASQSADLTEWQDSTGAVLAKVTSAGQIFEGASRVYSFNNKVPVAGLSATGTPSATTYLRGDNTWTTVPSSVTSVNTRTGAVIGLAEDNTVVHLTGNENIADVKTFSSAPVVPVDSFAIAATANLQTTLDSKYSGTNVPPYPVTSVATRTGAVILTAADIVAGVFPTGAFRFTANATNTIPIVSRGASGQTGDLQEWQDSAGGILARITSTGDFYRTDTASTGAVYLRTTSGYGNITLLNETSPGVAGIIGRLQYNGRSSLGTAVTFGEFRISSDIVTDGSERGVARVYTQQSGALTEILRLGDSGSVGQVYTKSVDPANKVVVVRGDTAQTGNLQEWQSITGTILSRVAADGTIWVGSTQLGAGGTGSGNATDTEIMSIMGGF
jgi:hypothetical protein